MFGTSARIISADRYDSYRGERGVVATAVRGNGGSGIRLASIVAEIAGAALIVVAATALPWVRYQVRGARVVVSLDAGSLGAVLVILSVVAFAAGAVQVLYRSAALCWVEIATGAVVLVISVVTAASRISHANSMTVTAGGSTGFAVGCGLSIIGGVVLTAAAVSVLILDSPRSHA